MKSEIIIVTGASRGLGKAMCEAFAELGHTVIGCGRSPESIAELSEQFGSDHRFDVVDVAGDRQVAEWAGAVLDQFGAPDFLINNAALINSNASLWEVPASEFSQVIDVNIKGVANVIRHFVPAMIANRSGVIVNFSSGWGRSTSADVAPYCATKWAIEGLTQAMAQELPSGMAAVPLNPGVINTEMLQSCFAGGANSYPKAAEWAQTAVPLILGLNETHNGEPMSV